MRAVRLHRPGGPEQLALDELETPQPGEGELLVRVHAAAITRDELTWPLDRLPTIPSYELSGVAEDGEEVYGLAGFDRDGAAADYAVVPATGLAPKPGSLSHVEAAALPLAGLSAWQGLFDHGRLEAGERVLIHGGAGGVGHLAVQLAKQRGAYVIATTSRDEDWVSSLGADEVLDHGFDSELDPVDLVFDTAGGERLERSVAVLRDGGRLVTVAHRHEGAVFFIVEPNREQLIELARLADARQLRPEVDAVFPLADARRAFERCESRVGRGKVVLSLV